MGSIKKFILFITYDDQMIEYVLPGMNDRKYMLNLYNKTGIEDMEVSLEVSNNRKPRKQLCNPSASGNV